MARRSSRPVGSEPLAWMQRMCMWLGGQVKVVSSSCVPLGARGPLRVCVCDVRSEMSLRTPTDWNAQRGHLGSRSVVVCNNFSPVARTRLAARAVRTRHATARHPVRSPGRRRPPTAHASPATPTHTRRHAGQKKCNVSPTRILAVVGPRQFVRTTLYRGFNQNECAFHFLRTNGPLRMSFRNSVHDLIHAQILQWPDCVD